MDRKNIIIIVLSVILIAAVCVMAYMFFFNEHYETVQVSSTASLEMPVGNGIKSEYLNKSSIYVIYNGHTGVKEKIISYNSNNQSLSDAMAYAMLRTAYCGETQNKIVEQDINGTHYYSIATGNNNTHDNIIITSTSKEKTQKMYDSIKYNQTNNTAVNNTAKHINNDTTNQTNNNQQSSQVKEESTEKSVSDNNPNYIKKDSNGNPTYTQAENGYWYVTTESGQRKGAGYASPP